MKVAGKVGIKFKIKNKKIKNDITQIKSKDQVMNMLEMFQEHAGLSSRGSQEGLIARPQFKLEVCCCWWMCRASSTLRFQ